MTDKVTGLVGRIRALQDELEDEFERRRTDFHYRLEQGKVVFESDVLQRHKAIKSRLKQYIIRARPLVFITAPAIYAVIVPFVLLDIFVSLYQMICFPVYGIEKVRRTDHMTFDRKQLSYLNGLEKLNCMYCSYGNGLLSYASEIAGLTEKHWCPIKHAKRMEGVHRHYAEFLEFGDAEGYRKKQRSSARTPKA